MKETKTKTTSTFKVAEPSMSKGSLASAKPKDNVSAATPKTVHIKPVNHMVKMDLRGAEKDTVSDEQAARNARGAPIFTHTAAPVIPVPKVENPLVAQTKNVFDPHGKSEHPSDYKPNWLEVQHLPGYGHNAVRSTVRKLFSNFTDHPLESIKFMSDATHSSDHVKRMATHIVQNGERDSATEASAFKHFPDYKASIQIWKTPDHNYAVAKDVAGHYIYQWPGGSRKKLTSEHYRLPSFAKFLTEAQVDHNKLMAKAMADPSVHTIIPKDHWQHAEDGTPHNPQAGHVKLAKAIIRHIGSLDPSGPKRSYTPWMTNQYIKGNIQRLEDVPRAANALSLFQRFKSELPKHNISTDINSHDLKGLEHHVSRFEEHREESFNTPETMAHFKNGSADHAYSSPDLHIVVPHTREASQHFGSQTKWCTAASRSHNYFDTYNVKEGQPSGDKGKLHYLITPHTKHAIYVPYYNNQKVSAFNAQDEHQPIDRLLKEHPHFKEGMEHYLKSKPKMAVTWAASALRDRFHAAEPEIAKNGKTAAIYAHHVIKGPWAEGDHAIKSDPDPRVQEYYHNAMESLKEPD